jgi:hypothetical protein
MPKIFGREVAVWVALFAAGLQALTAFGLHISDDLQSILTAAVAALLGLVVAFMVGDGVIAAALGFVQAFFSVLVGFGLDWSAENQAKLLSFVAIALGVFVRQNVVAPVPATAVSGPVVLKQ